MSQTLKHELRIQIDKVLRDAAIENAEVAQKLVDTVMEVRTFQLLGKAGIDFKIAAGLPITQDDLTPKREDKIALDTFERELGFNPLPWYSTHTWNKMAKYIIDAYKQDPQCFAKYAQLRRTKGWLCIQNQAIIRFPEAFMIAGWPEETRLSAESVEGAPRGIDIQT